MQFRVVVPEHSSGGETLRIHISDGTEANVTIPSDRKAGDSFVFEVPTDQMANPHALSQQAAAANANANTANPPLSPKGKRKSRKHKQQQQHPIAEIDTSSSHPAAASAVATPVTAASSGGYVLSPAMGDFVSGLVVGGLVGSSILVGFLLGICHATEAIYALHPLEKPKTPLGIVKTHGAPPPAPAGR